LKRLLVIALAMLIVVYLADYFWFRYRMRSQKPGDPLEVVKVKRLYAVAQKNGRVEYILAEPVDTTCVHSIFPHAGYSPCWYVVQQSGRPIPMVILPPGGWIAEWP
jgi:hypothetical protein